MEYIRTKAESTSTQRSLLPNHLTTLAGSSAPEFVYCYCLCIRKILEDVGGTAAGGWHCPTLPHSMFMKSHWQLEIDHGGGLKPQKLADSTNQVFYVVFVVVLLKNF